MDPQAPIQPEQNYNPQYTPAGQQFTPPPYSDLLSGMGDPGRKLSIAGLALAWLPPVGFILSFIGRNKSRAVGLDGKLGKLGMVANGITAVIAIIVVLSIVAAGDTSKPKGGRVSSSATPQVKNTEASIAATGLYLDLERYQTRERKYLTSLDELRNYDGVTTDFSRIEFATSELTAPPDSEPTAVLYACGQSGFRVGRWDYFSNKYVTQSQPATLSDEADCKILAN